MTKDLRNIAVSLPHKDLSFFKELVKRMGWTINNETENETLSDEQAIEEYTLETIPLKLNITLTNYYNIIKGKKKIYRHSISDYECAYKLFLHNYGKICVSDKFKSIKSTWNFTDSHNGYCPFIIRQYKSVIFTCEALEQKLETEIEGMIKVKYNKDSNKWYFEFKIGKIKK